MRKSELKSDLIVYNKLKDEIFKAQIVRVYDIFTTLKISNNIEYYIYQVHINELTKITYEEIMSYIRLLNIEYFNSIKLLDQQLKNRENVIMFPKSIN